MKTFRDMSEVDQSSFSNRVAATGTFRIGLTICDLRAALVRRGKREERLEPRLVGVLALLVQHAPEPVTRDMFLDLVWDGEGSDEALTQAISRLRRIFAGQNAIKTHPRIGYSLTGIDAAPDGSNRWRKPARSAPPLEHRISWKVGSVAVLAGILILVGVLMGHLWPRTPGEQEFVPLKPDTEFLPKN